MPSIEIGKTIYGVICTVVVLRATIQCFFFVVGYNFVADKPTCIFVRLAAVVSQICEIMRTIPRKIELIAVQGHQRSSIWVLVENLLVYNSNFGRITYRFRNIYA